jgi:acyl carrier protein
VVTGHAVPRAEVARVVAEVLRDLLPDVDRIDEKSRIVDDLHLVSDDDLDMIWRLEDHFGLAIPPEEWGSVVTVADAIDLVHRYVSSTNR